ncbi:DUF2933 domain-containing protein [Acidobacteria bacterium AB60]|nr:DUF2933 domain-containing protein [Acidobacteria bacterium AB60]
MPSICKIPFAPQALLFACPRFHVAMHGDHKQANGSQQR